MPAVEATVTHLPMDWVIVALFALLLAIDTMRSGTRHAIALSFAAPLALLASSELSYTAWLGSLAMKITSAYASVGIFAVLFLLFLILIYLMLPSTSSGTLPLGAVLAGIAGTVVLATVALQLTAISDLVVVSPLFHTIFGSSFRLFWLLAAYILLAIARW